MDFPLNAKTMWEDSTNHSLSVLLLLLFKSRHQHACTNSTLLNQRSAHSGSAKTQHTHIMAVWTLVWPSERVLQIVVHALSMLGSPTLRAHHNMFLLSRRTSDSFGLCFSFPTNALKQLLLGYDQRIGGYELLILIFWDILEVSAEAHCFLLFSGLFWLSAVFLIWNFWRLSLLLFCC